MSISPQTVLSQGYSFQDAARDAQSAFSLSPEQAQITLSTIDNLIQQRGITRVPTEVEVVRGALNRRASQAETEEAPATVQTTQTVGVRALQPGQSSNINVISTVANEIAGTTDPTVKAYLQKRVTNLANQKSRSVKKTNIDIGNAIQKLGLNFSVSDGTVASALSSAAYLRGKKGSVYFDIKSLRNKVKSATGLEKQKLRSALRIARVLTSYARAQNMTDITSTKLNKRFAASALRQQDPIVIAKKKARLINKGINSTNLPTYIASLKSKLEQGADKQATKFQNSMSNTLDATYSATGLKNALQAYADQTGTQKLVDVSSAEAIKVAFGTI